MVITRLYRDGVLVKEGFPVGEISDHLAEDGCTVWADFVSPTAADLADIEKELSLHPLAVEDAVQQAQRPKLDRYDTHLFLATYFISLDGTSGELSTAEVKAFITPQALITVHGPDFDMRDVVTHWDDDLDLAKYGVAYLLWGLLDVIVDAYFGIVEELSERLDEVEDALFDPRPQGMDVQRRSFEFRKSLVLMRRYVMPMREVVNSVLRRDLNTFDVTMTPYFQDVYDHVLRAADNVDSLRDLVSTILDTNLSLQGNRMNLIMKKVTSWAAIIAVPTAITGFFGQNVAFPGFGTVWGLVASLVLMVGASVALYLTFKRRDWV